MYDERDAATDKIIRPGVMDRMPDMGEMRQDIVSMGITNPQHYETMKDVFERYGVILDPHGAVGWRTLDIYLEGCREEPAVIYETADPGKFPEDVERAIGLEPDLPPGMQKQAGMEERIYSIESTPDVTPGGFKLSEAQVEEAKAKIREIFKG